MTQPATPFRTKAGRLAGALLVAAGPAVGAGTHRADAATLSPAVILSLRPTSSTIQVSWRDTSDGESGFLIPRRLRVGGFETRPSHPTSWLGTRRPVRSCQCPVSVLL
jgi:hypothetical protein